ncbi:MAG: hypothetical protein PHF60_02125 [Candidatus ainarchaeum sp.]|nr:hypothetical protein [Candidatus ainarchaeum sp.]
MRAFIFSLDSFVAFTLALIAIYSLIFFSSVPSAYYFLLTQAHYLARDSLLAVSTSDCITGGCDNPDGTVLDNIAFHTDPDQQKELIKSTIGLMVPQQFGYTVSLSEDSGQGWTVLYDTATEGSDLHAKSTKKLTVSTQVMTFGYSAAINKLKASPYNYATCGAGADGGEETEAAEGATSDFGIITCGEMEIDNGDGTSSTKPLGNIHPSVVLEGDLVPAADARIVKLTIFI